MMMYACDHVYTSYEKNENEDDLMLCYRVIDTYIIYSFL